MDQTSLGRTANHTVMHTECHYRLHYGNTELNDYHCRVESPIRKVAQMCLKNLPQTTHKILHKHSITNQESVNGKEMVPLNNSK